MTVTFLDPFPKTSPASSRRSVALRDVSERPVLALIDNGKPKAARLLIAVGEALIERGVIESYFVHHKRAMVPIDDDERAAIVRRAGVVIAGVGDCGGCTACSTTDALRLREVGVRAHVVVTEQFIAAFRCRRCCLRARRPGAPRRGASRLEPI